MATVSALHSCSHNALPTVSAARSLQHSLLGWLAWAVSTLASATATNSPASLVLQATHLQQMAVLPYSARSDLIVRNAADAFAGK